MDDGRPRHAPYDEPEPRRQDAGRLRVPPAAEEVPPGMPPQRAAPRGALRSEVHAPGHARVSIDARLGFGSPAAAGAGERRRPAGAGPPGPSEGGRLAGRLDYGAREGDHGARGGDPRVPGRGYDAFEHGHVGAAPERLRGGPPGRPPPARGVPMAAASRIGWRSRRGARARSRTPRGRAAPRAAAASARPGEYSRPKP